MKASLCQYVCVAPCPKPRQWCLVSSSSWHPVVSDRGGNSSLLTLQQKTLRVSAAVTHSGLPLHKDTHSNTDINHTHSPCISCSFWHSMHTLGLRSCLQPLCCGQLFYKARGREQDGKWGMTMEYAHSHKGKECAVIHKATKDRDSITEL